ncbi:hypothetical protein GYH30_006573 [Glycine max]|uniref:RNase H type-1 domain-containing protein n=1 Tax=Glycine max TaxID=3847 RepID=A0A0R0KNF6_SOYBN|nr:hypothetical protein GYH30_006573 [Glycine max]
MNNGDFVEYITPKRGLRKGINFLYRDKLTMKKKFRVYENEWHLFITCEKSKQIWITTAKLWDVIQPKIKTAESYNDFIFNLLEQLHPHKSSQSAMILWYIRKTRNQKVWENVETTSSIVVSLALQSYSEWLSADASNNIYISASPPSTSQQIWTPPAIGLPKCNFDAIIFKDQNVFGIGMCLRDDNGTFIKAKTKHYQGTPQPQEAEVYALHQALVWIQQFKMMKDNLAATKPRASLSTIQKSL